MGGVQGLGGDSPPSSAARPVSSFQHHSVRLRWLGRSPLPLSRGPEDLVLGQTYFQPPHGALGEAFA